MLILQIGLQRYFFFFTNQLFSAIIFTSYLKISLPSANNKSPLRTKQGAGPSCPAPQMTVGANGTMPTDGLPFGLLADLKVLKVLRVGKRIGQFEGLWLAQTVSSAGCPQLFFSSSAARGSVSGLPASTRRKPAGGSMPRMS